MAKKDILNNKGLISHEKAIKHAKKLWYTSKSTFNKNDINNLLKKVDKYGVLY